MATPDTPSNPDLTPIEAGIEPENDAATRNVVYAPRSRGTSPGTLIPANMAASAQKALDVVEQRRGDVDEFVCGRLGYASHEAMWRVLYAEQIDSLALAFDQRDQSKIFLNGDQTGNGKGRFGAANIIDVQRQGLIPVFVTRQPNLYNAMMNDLADIGKSRFTPFATNNNLDLTLDDGRKLKTGDNLSQEAAMQRLMRQGGLGSEYDAVFTTYTQLQTIKNKEPLRRDFLRALAPRAVFIFDESHEAGGSTGDTDAWKAKGPKNRAEFVRELIDQASGAVFLSATATKDPAVMDLYARRSDAIHAVSHMGSLKRMLKAGGIPLQQMMATKFVASGQLLRRERSFENISFDAQVVPVNRAIADGISDIMRAVDVFDRAKGEAIREIRKQLKQEAKQLGLDNAIGQIGVQSTNFTSLMHNAIDQGLLSQKAEATVQTAVQSLQKGEKPLIALASTMDAFIKTYADDNGIELGDSIDDISFGDVLYRYLERSRDVVVRDYEGFQTRRPLTDDELGADAIAAYDTACELIAETDLSEIPLSSIDYIKWRLGQEGYSVDEITGRENIIDYDPDGQMSYARRPSKQTSPQGKIEIVNRFNGGELDVVILNRSGSTGINLHASEKFADQRPRHMILVQAERDINQVMQMLGRANRFGQVVEPRFTLLMSDLPAEKRLGALLAKKMASLNANTTASRDSDLSVTNVVDFMNVYGEAVITEILEDDLELEAKLSFPSSKLQGNSDTELISRVTGRIPLLPIEEQEALYARIETETQELIAQKQAMGENVLAAEQLDLDARTIARMEVIPEESTVRNEFTGSVYLDVVDTKIPVKPPTQLQVINAVRQTLDLEAVPSVEDHDFEQVEAIAHTQVLQTRADLLRQLDRYRDTAQQKKKTPEGISKLNERLNRQRDHVITTLATFVPGTSVQVASAQGGVVYGVVTNVWQKGNQGSPAAPTNWRMQILTANQARQVTLPLSKVNTRKDSSVAITPQALNWDGGDIYTSFDLKQSQLRQEAQIFTGNLLRAFEKYPKGQFLNYTDNQGRIRQGLMMPAGFDIEESLRAEPVAFREPYQVKAFLTELTQHQGAVKSLDEVVVIKSQKRARYSHSNTDGFVVQTPKATSVGGRYFLDEDILTAVEGDFYSVSDRMEVMITEAQLDRVLEVVMQQKQITLAAFDLKETAREYLGEELPSLELVESGQYAEQGHYVPHVPEPTNTTRLQLEGLLAQEAPTPSEPQESPDLTESPDPTASMGTSENPKHGPTSSQGEQPSSETPHVLRAKEQKGGAEKQVAKFLHEAGLAEAVLQGEDFHLRIENEPFIPLVVERHGAQMYLTHYLTQNGDMFIDAEMVFQVSNQGHLRLQETAVQLMGGEHRNLDRGFAQMFARNINHQGFAEAAQGQLTTVEADVATPEPSPIVDEAPEPVTEMPSDIQPSEDATVSQPDEGTVVLQDAESTVQTTGPPELPQEEDATVVSTSEHTVSQEVEQLRDWYRAARDLGRGPAQLEYIKSLGQSAKEVNGQRFVFPQAAQQTMTQDLEQYQVYRQRGSYVAQASHFILGAIGQVQGDTKRFQGTIYELEETADTLTVRKRQPQPQVILRVRQDHIHRTMVTAEDCQTFKSFVQRLNRDLTQQKGQWPQSNAQTHVQQ